VQLCRISTFLSFDRLNIKSVSVFLTLI